MKAVYLYVIVHYVASSLGTKDNDTSLWQSGKSVSEFYWCPDEPSSTEQPVVLDTGNMCYRSHSAGATADGYICEKEPGTYSKRTEQ